MSKVRRPWWAASWSLDMPQGGQPGMLRFRVGWWSWPYFTARALLAMLAGSRARVWCTWLALAAAAWALLIGIAVAVVWFCAWLVFHEHGLELLLALGCAALLWGVLLAPVRDEGPKPRP